MKKLRFVPPILALLFLVWALLDAVPGNNLLAKYYFSSKQCDFRIPKGFMLVKDDDNNYAIQDTSGYGDRYLTINVNDVGVFHRKIINPVTFKDSCRTKGLLKKYLELPANYSEDNTPFKPVKNRITNPLITFSTDDTRTATKEANR